MMGESSGVHQSPVALGNERELSPTHEDDITTLSQSSGGETLQERRAILLEQDNAYQSSLQADREKVSCR